jgi:hypothetical protein
MDDNRVEGADRGGVRMTLGGRRIYSVGLTRYAGVTRTRLRFFILVGSVDDDRPLLPLV